MKRVLAVIAIAGASLAFAAPGSLARGTSVAPNTTQPGYNFRIDVTISAKGVVLSRSIAKRGWLAHFVIHNKTTKPHVFDIGGLKTKPIAAGAQAKLGSFLDTRGQYAYKVDKKTRGYFTVI